jgi:hypothetical protein
VILALLVSLVCLDGPGAAPRSVSVSAVKHNPAPGSEVVATDAQCCECPCWLPPVGQCGCAIHGSCSWCGYINIAEFPSDIPWGPFTTSDGAGCVDMDLLPTPRNGWIYWVMAR